MKHRSWLLLAANLFFLYSVNTKISFAFITIALINYFLTIKSLTGRKHWYQCLILINVIFLAAFKYILPAMPDGSLLYYVLPVGISLFVFQQISFVVDRNSQEELQNISCKDFLIYTFFFIPFSTGPLTRIEQLYKNKEEQLYFNSQNFIEGCILFYSGVFKKFVIADNISFLTGTMFNPKISGIQTGLLIPFLLSKYEIFANFSGFTDMALGMGLILGFKLPQNFNRPFATTSIVEFWKRWHMSLSLWIRDYVFYPLSVSKFGRLGAYAILTVTFLIFAAWHDIKLTYLSYGLIQVILIFLAHKFSKSFKAFNQSINSAILKKIVLLIDWIIFYSITLSIPGILFRSTSLGQFTKIMSMVSQSTFKGTLSFVMSTGNSLLYVAAGILLYEIFDYKLGIQNFTNFFQKRSYVQKIIIFYLLIILVLVFYSDQNNTGFVYSIF